MKLPTHHGQPAAAAEMVVGPDEENLASAGILDPGYVWSVLRRSRVLIGTITGLALLAAGAALLVIPPQYSATAIVLVDPRQQRVLQSEAVLSGIGNDTAAVESQVEVIQSTTLAQKVISDLHLDQDPEFNATSLLRRIGTEVRKALGLRSTGADTRMDRIVAKFENSLTVVRRGVTYVLELSFSSTDADKAARIANAIAQAYLAEQVGAKFDATAQASGWLNARLADLQRQVADAERAVADYKARQGLVETGDRRTLIDQQLADLNRQLGEARFHTSDVRSRYDQMRTLTANSIAANGLPEALQSQVILALRTQYAQAARGQAELAQVYGPLHPSLRAGEAQLASLKRQIANELARIAAGLRNDLAIAESRERALEESMAKLKQASATTDRATVKLRELERNAEATRTVLQQFLLRFKETSEQESLQTPDARIISPASTPLYASSPNPLVLFSLAGVGGLALGIGAALARARGIRSADEVEKLLSLPVYGVVPMIEFAELAGPKPRSGRGSRAPEPGSIMTPLRRLGVDQPLSRFGNAMRDMAIRLRTTHLADSHVLLVTSALPEEGASTIAANLANVLARSGCSTLLIDADFRGLSEKETARAEGLCQALRDGAPPLSLLKREPGTGLNVLPAGTAGDAAQASELLTGARMDAVLGDLRRKFEVVVIDGAPLLAAVESRYLLALADSALLVVAWDKTERESVQAALRAAGPSAAKIEGIVLNKVDLSAYKEQDGAFVAVAA